MYSSSLNPDSFSFCHQCKQRLPSKMVVKCRYNRGPAEPERCNEAGVLIYNVEAYNMASIQTILNKTLKKKNSKLIDCCQRSFCILCLQHNYDSFSYDEIKKPDWYCPFCKGICSCTRCMRQDQLTKMRAHLFSMGGSLEYLS